jgi:hypothetical protein
LLFCTARLILLLLATTPAITMVAHYCASRALGLSGCVLRSLFACGFCSAFLVAHSRFNSKRMIVDLRVCSSSRLNKAKSLNRPVVCPPTVN